MNPWPVYEATKRHWRSTRKRLSMKELQLVVPGATEEEIKEGMIEFELAYESTFKHEEYDIDARSFMPELYFKPSKNQNVRSRRGQR